PQISPRKVWIDLDRLLEVRYCHVSFFLAKSGTEAGHMILALQVSIERSWVHGTRIPQLRPLIRRHLDLDLIGDGPGYGALYCKYVLQVTIVSIGPQVGVGASADQLCGDPDSVARAQE